MTTYETLQWKDLICAAPTAAETQLEADAGLAGAIPFGLDDGGDEPAPAGAAAAFTTDAEAR